MSKFTAAEVLQEAKTCRQMTGDRIAEMLRAFATLLAEREQVHTDHPSRHYDRTCPACNAAPSRSQSLCFQGFMQAQQKAIEQSKWEAVAQALLVAAAVCRKRSDKPYDQADYLAEAILALIPEALIAKAEGMVRDAERYRLIDEAGLTTILVALEKNPMSLDATCDALLAGRAG